MYERVGTMKYTIGNQIGDKGGFGDVHVCSSEKGDKYAIKLLANIDASSTERFKKEIRLIMRLSHPNIIKVIAYDADSDRKYYIMPLYASSLKAIIPSLNGMYDRQYNVISEILNGVIYLHSEGVLHRDLKPQNILYNSDSDIVINDFGLGRQIDSGSDRLTRIGAGFGTPRYTAPEQLTDASSADERADIFSIGKIIEDIVTNMSSNPVPTLEFEYIINRCTQTNPIKRFSTVLELKSAVDSIYNQLLGIAENDTVDDLIAKIKLGNICYEEAHDLAVRLIHNDNSDKIEEFFYSLPNEHFLTLEQKDADLTENLIIQLQQYFTSQGWGFGYTDTIGSNCRRLYMISSNIIVRANLLYAIIEVGISHNRFYVMGIAADLLQAIKNNTAESLELAELLRDRNTYLDRLDLGQNDLPVCLKPYYIRDPLLSF